MNDKHRTKSVRLSKFAAHNTFHHCEECHHYCDASPASQVRAASWTSEKLDPLGSSRSACIIQTHQYRLTMGTCLFVCVSNVCLSLCVSCSLWSAPSTLLPSAHPCWGRRSRSSLSFLKPRSRTLSSASRAAKWRACVSSWSPPRFVPGQPALEKEKSKLLANTFSP